MSEPSLQVASIPRAGKRSLAMFLSLAFSLLSAALVGGAAAGAVAAPPALSTIQVLVQTESSLPNYFVVSAYNSTGALVTTSQSQYPAGSLELPAGTYFLTATATTQSSYYQPYPVYSAGGSVAPSSAQGASSPAVCCVYAPPVIEYGYTVQKVTGPTSLTIPTRTINDTSYSTISIKASLPNGTAASGASVSASVLGDWYWGAGPNAISMYNTTGADGGATLVTPNVPVLVSIWASLPVNLPTNQTTIQQTIAGEKVNVTVYWAPTYVSFGGWSLVTPPQQSASVTLHYQQPMYYAYSKTGLSGPSSQGAASSAPSQGSVVYPDFGPGGISQPSGSSAQTIYTTGGATTTASSSPNYGAQLYFAVGFGAAAVGALIVVVALRSRRNR